MNNLAETYLADTIVVFRQHKQWADEALEQLTDEKSYFQPLGPRSQSVAIIVKHLAGNLKSRWTDFLTTDGEKPNRWRDQEFVLVAEDTRQNLTASWELGWSTLFTQLSNLQPDDLTRTVKIRGEPHSVVRAIQRSLAHAAYHTGQLLYLCRLLKSGEWRWLTVAPGQSDAHTQAVAEQFKT